MRNAHSENLLWPTWKNSDGESQENNASAHQDTGEIINGKAELGIGVA
jgi:hypothetical protein